MRHAVIYWPQNVEAPKSARTSAPEGPRAEEVRAQLTSILASHRFRNAGAQKLLLRYVVERALEGDFDALDEAAIADAVFARGKSLDSDADATVRMLADRLRKRLDRYYSRRRPARIRIDLPKASYIPVFTYRQCGLKLKRWIGLAAALAVAAIGLAWFLHYRGFERRTYRSVAVLPFFNANRTPEVAPQVEGVVRRLTSQLVKYERIRVSSAPYLSGEPARAPDLARRLSVDALLTGSVYLDGGDIRIVLELVDGRDGRRLWSDVYEASESLVPDMTSDIAYAVAKALGTGDVR